MFVHPRAWQYIHYSQKVEATQMSIDGWMDKYDVVYHTMEYYSALKKEGNSNKCYNIHEP